MTDDELLSYRVTQLEERMRASERAHERRPNVIATVTLALCAIAQTAVAVLLITGGLR